MVTLVYTGMPDIQVAWVLTYRTYALSPFHCLGDHGLYCPIRFGGE